MGKTLGYGRVSSDQQDVATQKAKLEKLGAVVVPAEALVPGDEAGTFKVFVVDARGVAHARASGAAFPSGILFFAVVMVWAVMTVKRPETHKRLMMLNMDPPQHDRFKLLRGDRQRVRALAQLVACDVHPLNNLRVLQYFERDWGVPQAERDV